VTNELKPSARELAEWRQRLVSHFVAGTIRYEKFPDSRNGELCFAGIRHCADLDVDGCPRFDRHLLQRLRAAVIEGGRR